MNEQLNRVVFPIYRIRKYHKLEKTPLGKLHIYSLSGKHILDDTSLKGDTLAERRLQIPKKQRYKLGEKVDKLRQLVKYPGGTVFIDSYGTLFKYTKNRKRHLIESKKILKKEFTPEGTILYIENLPNPELVRFNYVGENINYASIMYTDMGPFIYDYTREPHESFRKSI